MDETRAAVKVVHDRSWSGYGGDEMERPVMEKQAQAVGNALV
jgi:hypothetical protein